MTSKSKKSRRASSVINPETDVPVTIEEIVIKPAPKTKKVKGKLVTKGGAKPKKEKAPKAEKPKRKPIEAYDKLKNGKMSARGLTCLCGCGAPTVNADARFISGHDSRLRQALLDGGKIPEIVMPFFVHGETIAGLKLSGGKIVDTKGQGGDEEADSDEE